jgi:NAD(P)-dependent dehydrogenase (short-subunit alcohol dehydrogenase family)
MPKLHLIRAGIAELPKGSPLVVAITGGTSGIGSYVARAFARTFANHGSKLRVYVVGRNATRAEALLTYGRNTSPGSDWRFVQALDLSLMSEVDHISQEITKQEEEAPFAGGPARLDVLYMGQALSPFQKSNRRYAQSEPKARILTNTLQPLQRDSMLRCHCYTTPVCASSKTSHLY